MRWGKAGAMPTPSNVGMRSASGRRLFKIGRMPTRSPLDPRAAPFNTTEMDTEYRKTLKTYDIDGDAHFLTFSCYQRRTFFTRDRFCEFVIDAINRGREKWGFDLWAFVFMPEHIHLMILPQHGTKISQIRNSIKQSASKRAVAWLRRHAPSYLKNLEDIQPNGNKTYRIWQRGGGYDRNLRSSRDIHEKIRYIHENPIRRGLVSIPSDWKWSSALSWETGDDHPLSIDRESIPPLTRLDDRLDSELLR